ncbi:Hsp20/alpha crystallin family protein [Kiritimatiellaeota bacterium B1221]|nr:Hsp20/alpha crystallin family protein [Kiritimatiellaeota bacterium B1221]
MVHMRTPWIFQDLVEELDRMSRNAGWTFCGADAAQSRLSAVEVDGDQASYTLDLPGVAETDLELVLENDRLRILARREDLHQAEDEVLLHERTYGEFVQEVKLPWPVREEEVEATLKQGVLHLIMKRSPEAGPHKIEVNSK